MDWDFETLKKQIIKFEKPLLLSAIQTSLNQFKSYYKGIGCDVYEIDNETLAFAMSNRFSCFDSGVCEESGKGIVIATQNAYWFKLLQTSGPDIGSHFLDHINNVIIAVETIPKIK